MFCFKKDQKCSIQEKAEFLGLMSKERRSTEISSIIIMTLQEGTPMIKAILTMHLYRGASMNGSKQCWAR